MFFTNGYFQTYRKMILHWLFLFLTLFFLTFTGCTIGSYTDGTLYQLSSRPLSENNPDLRTCIFDPAYSIVHFPMHHYPADGHYTPQQQEQITQSQFQLLHTILDYSRSRSLLLFDEHITVDKYNSQYLQSLSSGQFDEYTRVDGYAFQMAERLQTAQRSFGHGIPNYYEHLSPVQKDYLFNMGASFTAFLLGKIPRIYKVINPGHFISIRDRLLDSSGRFNFQGKDHLVYDEREIALRTEVLNFWRSHNPRTIFMIAFGARHDFSNEFVGFPFQSGHNFCLNWLNQSVPYQPVLP